MGWRAFGLASLLVAMAAAGAAAHELRPGYLHRNVIFRGNGAQAGLVEPFTTFPPGGSDNPVDLWRWMGATEEKTGGEVLAIAHNGNLSTASCSPRSRPSAGNST